MNKTPREILTNLAFECMDIELKRIEGRLSIGETLDQEKIKVNQALIDLDALVPSEDRILYILEHTPYERIEGFIKTAHTERLRRRLAKAVFDEMHKIFRNKRR